MKVKQIVEAVCYGRHTVAVMCTIAGVVSLIIVFGH